MSWVLFQTKLVRKWLNEKKSLVRNLLLCSVGSCWGCSAGTLQTVLHSASAGTDHPLPIHAWDEDACGVPVFPGGISPAGEQSMHLPGAEQRENQTGEKIVAPQGVFAAPGERET